MSDTPKTTRYALVITDDGELVTNTVHDTRRERRDACVEVLKSTCHDVTEAEVTDILLAFGGADPDGAIGSISELYAEYGVDIYLEDQPVPADPKSSLGLPLHSVFISYADTTSNTIEHFPTPEARAAYLRQRLNNLCAAVSPDETVSEEDLAAKVQQTLLTLIDQNVCVHLISSPQPDWAA